ncbi:carbamoyltransferase HypF [Candidatus Poriferisodalis sp.]|uniref:carbamoyltransferase HypF n=1 Tax=Candidatus Poriferisodalis sp. TaxID=3101277 RepID=UPI003B02AE3D
MQRRRLRITGTVQGVGFRPYVHRLARDLSLTGIVGNDSAGVWCEIQGSRDNLDEFEVRVAADAPPLAAVDSVRSEDMQPVAGERAFSVAASTDDGSSVRVSTVPPDVATCSDCLAEVADPAGRRYRYAFTCCTDCGPRYTVIEELPYDRARTSMSPFPLCKACETEYADPGDRRHHAQAVCCPDCGPTMSLTAEAGVEAGDPIAKAAALLRTGAIVAIKGAGGYQLACRADDDEAVRRLRRRKHRDEKPFAVLARSLEAAEPLAVLDDVSIAALMGPEAPIVLAPRRHDAPLAMSVAPSNRLVGVMLPATPLHALLSEAVGIPLVCTSGNRTDEPIVIDDARVPDELGGIADAVLSHNRTIERRADDSVAQVAAGRIQLLRRARGYAPRPVRLGSSGPPVLAVGAELKSTVCLAIGAEACLSVHLGDLENEAALAGFELAIADLLALSRTSPELVVHDLHPEYLSTKFAASSRLGPMLGVQHHHAHLAACLADAGRSGPAIGAIFDGLGWGNDGTLWGGEILVGDASGCERVAHLRPVAMPGGTAAIREPWRMALAYLTAAYGHDVPPLAALRGHLEQAPQVLEQCRPGRSITTTSMGRLFDAVAVACGIGTKVTYEGQAAIGLEQLAKQPERRYRVELSEDAPAHIETASVVEAIVADLMAGLDPARVAGAFHRWVADVVLASSERSRAQTGIAVVALSGGVFQNRLLTELTVPTLTEAGFEVLLHRQVPPNDGGISLGQAAIGRAALTLRD